MMEPTVTSKATRSTKRFDLGSESSNVRRIAGGCACN
jgi:hypothetical protein